MYLSRFGRKGTLSNGKLGAITYQLVYKMALFSTAYSYDSHRARSLVPRRTVSILNSPAAIPDLPSSREAEAASSAAGIDLSDIQGDVVAGMNKKKELFLFFRINNAADFKSHLVSDIHPRLTSATELLSVALQPVTALNIAFSQAGLTALGTPDGVADGHFSQGQEDASNAFGDKIDEWVEAFKNKGTHGVLLLASDTVEHIDSELSSILGALGSSITEVHRIQGAARPGDQEGHEHFGYVDGISQPALAGIHNAPLPGQPVIAPGRVLFGYDGDFRTRPSWAKGGTIMSFRKLQQLVPEFDKYLTENALDVPGLSQEENKELLGARMVGRWKSGAPIDLAPLRDDPALGADPGRNNDFTFIHAGEDLAVNQTRCPFSAHIRKTRPRGDQANNETMEEAALHIMRSGIPYGPEVTEAERLAQTSSTDSALERGLAFVSYSMEIFHAAFFMQNFWMNEPSFPFDKSDSTPGEDPILGVHYEFDSEFNRVFGGPRVTSGLDPIDPNHDFTIPRFVIPRAAEYYFVPPISAILDPIAK